MKKYLIVIVAPLLIAIACNVGHNGKINLNQGASFSPGDTLPENPLLENVLTASINTNDSTMSTLYANRIAWEYATKHNDINYPEGAVLYQVTWQQKPDSVWYGANIPKKIQSIERISYTYNSKPVYELYEGSPLKRSGALPDTARITAITAQKMAVSP